jgi:hypothetical protein
MKMSDNAKTNLKQFIVIIATSLLTAILLSFIAPNGLRESVQKIELKQAEIDPQIKSNTARIETLEYNQLRLATKDDIQILKADLIRELKR